MSSYYYKLKQINHTTKKTMLGSDVVVDNTCHFAGIQKTLSTNTHFRVSVYQTLLLLNNKCHNNTRMFQLKQYSTCCRQMSRQNKWCQQYKHCFNSNSNCNNSYYSTDDNVNTNDNCYYIEECIRNAKKKDNITLETLLGWRRQQKRRRRQNYIFRTCSNDCHFFQSNQVKIITIIQITTTKNNKQQQTTTKIFKKN